jgi:hypothetical protein
VVIAEEITARFFNVISLFNGFIPIIAIQMSAIELGDAVTLVFTTVLGRTTLGSKRMRKGTSLPTETTGYPRPPRKRWLSRRVC